MSNKTNPFEGKTFSPEQVVQDSIVGWRSPSNIALVKYWGKHGNQLPRNPSLSFSLTNAHTETEISYSKKAEASSDSIDLTFSFEGQRNEAFEARIINYLNSLTSIYPYLTHLSFGIESKNSFPHSSGIASSASSMSALALCLTNIEYKLEGKAIDHFFFKKASYVSRLGSGSASRSVYENFCVWGASELGENCSDEYAVPLSETHAIFNNIHDDILIVSSKEKSVSSTAGHQLMESNPFASTRYVQARTRLIDLASIIKTGDVEAFGKIVEEEAMTLHALMMCSDPSYVLMEPGSLSVINEIRAYRKSSGVPIYFTLDAGPNVHVIYPDTVSDKAGKFVQEVLLPYCEDGRHICDRMGNGPEKIK